MHRFELKLEEEGLPVADFLGAYSIQSWLESAPQGYLMNTEYGHAPNEKEAPLILENPTMRAAAIRTTVQLVVGERCALAASSGLINSAPDEASKRFLATQTIDEARHVEVFTQRLYDLGVKKAELEDALKAHANPHLVKFAEVLLEKVDKKDFVAGVVGQNVILEGMAFHVFELMHTGNQSVNPKFGHTLSGVIADERRHVGFGENRIGSLIRENPGKKPEVQRMQRDMSYHMLATFAEAFRDTTERDEMERITRAAEARGEIAKPATWQGRDVRALPPAEMERLLGDTVLKEFKIRLERIGLEYQTPPGP